MGLRKFILSTWYLIRYIPVQAFLFILMCTVCTGPVRWYNYILLMHRTIKNMLWNPEITYVTCQWVQDDWAYWPFRPNSPLLISAESWSEWSDWSECEASGVQVRARQCILLFPVGSQCSGNTTESRPCVFDSNFIPGKSRGIYQ